MSKNDDEVLVRVEGVSKKFCRSLKKSLWYGVCDIASELNPFGRNTGQSTANKNLTTEDTESTEGGTGLRLSGPAGAAFSNPTTSGLAVDSQNTSLARAASNPCSSGEKALDSGPSPLDSTHGLRAGEFFAVKDVSFELRRGECLGLIGHNGAGKTTLLKMLNGLIKPDAGSITMRGRVGALIALGAGFNPILTGRENIYINGSVLGLTKKEIDAKIDEIIDFAEIREFIDMPVQSYSSGMSVRLGFAVASNMEPDILILDEVLAVGDIKFRNKCYDKIGSLIKKSAVILVTHNMSHVSTICTRSLLMKKGHSQVFNNPEEGIREIEKQMQIEGKNDGFEYIKPPITSAYISNYKKSLSQGDDFELEITAVADSFISQLSLRILLYNSEKMPTIDWWSDRYDFDFSLKKGSNKINIKSGPIFLKHGNYSLHIVIRDSSGLEAIYCSYLKHSIFVAGKNIGCANQLPKGKFEILN